MKRQWKLTEDALVPVDVDESKLDEATKEWLKPQVERSFKLPCGTNVILSKHSYGPYEAMRLQSGADGFEGIDEHDEYRTMAEVTIMVNPHHLSKVIAELTGFNLELKDKGIIKP